MTEIRYGLATHYHIDHAGLAQELKAAGMRLLVFDTQVHAVPLMKAHIKPQDHHVDISMHDNVVATFAESRAILDQLGITGEVIPTPGHSGDGVSLVLADGSAFTGDLTPPGLAEERDAQAVAASWELLRARGAVRVYPGHGPVREL